MHHDEAKLKIKEILDSSISFEGHFNKCFDNIKDSQQEELISWILDCKNFNVSPILSKNDRNLLGFVKRIGSNLRVLLTKKKDGYFLALFLDKHKYYEDEMSKLGF